MTAKTSSPPTRSTLDASINACIANGKRLLNDSANLEFLEPAGTRMVLAMIAQEEFAKALLLVQVRDGAVPWSNYLLRAMNNHACKHLVGIVIDYVHPELDSFDDIKRRVEEEFDRGDRVPEAVASALNILRHEKIGRWESNNWMWSEDPDYDHAVEKIAEGARDRIKQDALYVRIGRDGSIASVPQGISEQEAEAEVKRAERYASMVKSACDGEKSSLGTYEKIVAGFRLLFRRPSAPEA
jgi:AbiV family abortive infection protein